MTIRTKFLTVFLKREKTLRAHKKSLQCHKGIPSGDGKFEVLLLCLALSTKELETVWPALSQNNGLGWDITGYPWGGVSVG